MRHPVAVVLMLAAGPTVAGPVTPPSPRALRLLAEARRELSIMRSTRYAHEIQVDENAGRFDFDCSGFLDYALTRVDPKAYAQLPESARKERPLAQHFFALFAGGPPAPWRAVQFPEHLKPGDIVCWLRPDQSHSKNTGHVMLVRAHAYRNPDRQDEILVPIIDSTEDPHAEDSRVKGEQGLGTGLIGIIVDLQGRPMRYRWRGGLSKDEVETRFAFGRLE